MNTAPVALVLFDFDDVLAGYAHEARIAHLAEACGVEAGRVAQVLFASGLETEYDSGLIDTDTYLRRLGDGLGHPVDARLWIAARVAAARPLPGIVERVRAVAARMRTGVLTNNGALLAEAAQTILPELFPGWDGCVLCSGALRARKPDPVIFERALAHFATAAGQTLFLDDKLANVEAARSLGLRAEQVVDLASLDAALRAHGCAPDAPAGAAPTSA